MNSKVRAYAGIDGSTLLDSAATVDTRQSWPRFCAGASATVLHYIQYIGVPFVVLNYIGTLQNIT